MNHEAFREAMREIGRAGGLARAKKLSAKQLRASAVKASKAAARARSLKAKEKAEK
jgi:hypothetical protein